MTDMRVERTGATSPNDGEILTTGHIELDRESGQDAVPSVAAPKTGDLVVRRDALRVIGAAVAGGVAGAFVGKEILTDSTEAFDSGYEVGKDVMAREQATKLEAYGGAWERAARIMTLWAEGSEDLCKVYNGMIQLPDGTRRDRPLVLGDSPESMFFGTIEGYGGYEGRVPMIRVWPEVDSLYPNNEFMQFQYATLSVEENSSSAQSQQPSTSGGRLPEFVVVGRYGEAGFTFVPSQFIAAR